MDIKVRILVFLMSLLWLLFVLRMVKRRRIWERYAIFWVYIGFGVLLAPLLVDVFDQILYKIGFAHPPNFFFIVALLGILVILLQCTVEITTLVRRSRDSVQSLAILEARVRQLEREREEAILEAASSEEIE